MIIQMYKTLIKILSFKIHVNTSEYHVLFCLQNICIKKSNVVLSLLVFLLNVVFVLFFC